MISSVWYLVLWHRHVSKRRNRVCVLERLWLPFVLIRNIYPHPWLSYTSCNPKPFTQHLCVFLQRRSVFTDLSTQSESREQWLEAGASCPPTAYRKLLYVATPTPPRLLAIGAHMLHLLVCGSKHSIDLKQELPSRPPTANNLRNFRKQRSDICNIQHRIWREQLTSAVRCS